MEDENQEGNFFFSDSLTGRIDSDLLSGQNEVQRKKLECFFIFENTTLSGNLTKIEVDVHDSVYFEFFSNENCMISSLTKGKFCSYSIVENNEEKFTFENNKENPRSTEITVERIDDKNKVSVWVSSMMGDT